jgi:hypothetical protein
MLPALGAVLALCCSADAPSQADLGLGKMWTFENPPLGHLEREYGFRPDDAWLRSVMLASLRFGRGCSASFVSPHGLILTNHHCARDAIARAQGEHDWVRDGFVARQQADEVRLPGLTVQQLVKTTDITARVLAGVSDDDAAEAAEQKRKANQDRIEAEAKAADADLQPQIVKLFHGANFQLYQYRVFDDVRLVMAPHLQVAHFGGDPDNFTYPRFGIDFAFCRAYVEGRPADTSASHFRWSRGAEPEELVILTGNPGGTQRLLTRAQLEYLRDARYPRVRQMIDNRLGILRGFAAQGPELEKRLRTMILGLENGQKLYRGEHAALLDDAFMARKDAAEKALRDRIDADPALKARYGDLWARLAEVAARKKHLEGPANFHSAGGSPALLRAMAAVEAAGTGDAKKAEEARAVRIEADAVQQALFADHLERARRWLPADDEYLRAVLGARQPAEVAADLERGTRIGDDAFLEELLKGGKEAVARCEDPAVRIARVLGPLMAGTRRAQGRLQAEEDALGARMARAVFEIYGNAVSPDATFTLRFSDGRVRGYACNGTVAPWRTSFYGMLARHAEFDGVHPFDLPATWLERQNRLDLTAPVNFVCTVDSTGGNSGSPLINVRRELVGLLFDGNIESLANEFLYGEKAERSVCVHPRAIEEALTRIYDAHSVWRELWGVR